METSREAQAQTGLTFYFLGKTHAGLRKLSAYYRQRGFRVSNIAEPGEIGPYISEAAPDIILIDLQSRNDIRLFLDALGEASPNDNTPRVAIISSTTDDDTAAALKELCDESVSWPLKATDLSVKLFGLLTRDGNIIGAAQETIDGDTSLFRGNITLGLLKSLLQALYLSREDAVLTIESEGRRGNLWFKEGKLIDAQVGALDWEESLDLIRVFALGTFTIAFQQIDRRRFIEKNALQWLTQREAEDAAARSSDDDDLDFGANLFQGLGDDDDDDDDDEDHDQPPARLTLPEIIGASPDPDDEEAYEVTSSTSAFTQNDFGIPDYDDADSKKVGVATHRTLPALRALRDEDLEHSSSFGDYEDDYEDDDYEDDEYEDDEYEDDEYEDGDGTIAQVSISIGRFSREELEERMRLDSLPSGEAGPDTSFEDQDPHSHTTNIDNISSIHSFSDATPAYEMVLETEEADEESLNAMFAETADYPNALSPEEEEPAPIFNDDGAAVGGLSTPEFIPPPIAIETMEEDYSEEEDYEDYEDYEDDDYEDDEYEKVAAAPSVAISATPPAQPIVPTPAIVPAQPIVPTPAIATTPAPAIVPTPSVVPAQRPHNTTAAVIPQTVEDEEERKGGAFWLYPIVGILAAIFLFWIFTGDSDKPETPVAVATTDGAPAKHNSNRSLTSPGLDAKSEPEGRTERFALPPNNGGIIPPIKRQQPPVKAATPTPKKNTKGPSTTATQTKAPVATPKPTKTPPPKAVASTSTGKTSTSAQAPKATPTPRTATPVPSQVGNKDKEDAAAAEAIAVKTKEALDALLKKATAQENAGNLDKAIVLFAEAVDLAPGNGAAIAGLNRSQQKKSEPTIEGGNLTVNSMPYGLVYIDGEKAGYTPLHRKNTPPRKYVIRVTNPDYEACSVVEEVRPGELTFVHLKLDDDVACGRTKTP